MENHTSINSSASPSTPSTPLPSSLSSSTSALTPVNSPFPAISPQDVAAVTSKEGWFETHVTLPSIFNLVLSLPSSASVPEKKSKGGRKHIKKATRVQYGVLSKNTSPWLSCLFLSCWDNIMGPTLLYVWKNPPPPNHDSINEKENNNHNMNGGLNSPNSNSSTNLVAYSSTFENSNNSHHTSNNNSSAPNLSNNASSGDPQKDEALTDTVLLYISRNVLAGELASSSSPSISTPSPTPTSNAPSLNSSLSSPAVNTIPSSNNVTPSVSSSPPKSAGTPSKSSHKPSSSSSTTSPSTNGTSTTTGPSTTGLTTTTSSNSLSTSASPSSSSTAIVNGIVSTGLSILPEMPKIEQSEIKFHILDPIGYIILSVVFTLQHNKTPTSLSLVIAKRHLSRYLILHSLLEDRMTHFVTNLLHLLSRKRKAAAEEQKSELDWAIGKLAPDFLRKFSENMDLLFNSSLNSVPFKETFFHPENESFPNCSWKEDLEMRDFLAKSITSHLQTLCNTVVIGRSRGLVQTIVKSLAMFMTPQQRGRSSLLFSRYVPDILLQGILKEKDRDDREILSQEILNSVLPSTLIDVDNYQVYQTVMYSEYTNTRKEHRSNELDKLLAVKTIAPPPTAERIFKHVKLPASCITGLLHQISRLPVDLREGFLIQNLRLLTHKAAVIIKYVTASIAQNPDGNCLQFSGVKLMSENLDLTEEDRRLLLGLAEKYSPGLYFHVTGHPDSIEAKFIELFEEF